MGSKPCVSELFLHRCFFLLLPFLVVENAIILGSCIPYTLREKCAALF